MARRYDDFDLVFHASGENYTVQLINSPTGQAECEFVLPFKPGELRNFYGRIGQLSRTTRRVDRPEVAAAKSFGANLFNATFKGELLGCYRSSVERSREAGRGLRVRLRLKGTPELAELPWEFLYDQDQDNFIATSTMTPVVRYLDLPQGTSALRVRLPLRILVVISGPRNLPTLDADGEWERLKHSLQQLEDSGFVILERLPSARLDALRRRARGEPFHVIHFIGHGGFDTVANDGALHFEDAMGMSDPVHGNVLGNILRDHVSLRLAVLNACEGGRQSTEDPFSGVAQSLCQQGLPAVVAMQFEISDDAAKTFAEEFYAAVADSLPVDAALSESRKALYAGRYGQEWATPVLYMRSQNGMLFEVQKGERAPARDVLAQQQSAKAEAETRRKAEEARLAAEAERVAEARRIEFQRKAEAEQAEAMRKADAERLAMEIQQRAEVDRVAFELQRKYEMERQARDSQRKAESDRQAAETQRREDAERHAATSAPDLEAQRAADTQRQAYEAWLRTQNQPASAPPLKHVAAVSSTVPITVALQSQQKHKGLGWVIGVAIVGFICGLGFGVAMHSEYVTRGSVQSDDLEYSLIITIISALICRIFLRRLAKRPKSAFICAGCYCVPYLATSGPAPAYFAFLLPLVWAGIILIGRSMKPAPLPPAPVSS